MLYTTSKLIRLCEDSEVGHFGVLQPFLMHQSMFLDDVKFVDPDWGIKLDISARVIRLHRMEIRVRVLDVGSIKVANYFEGAMPPERLARPNVLAASQLIVGTR